MGPYLLKEIFNFIQPLNGLEKSEVDWKPAELPGSKGCGKQNEVQLEDSYWWCDSRLWYWGQCCLTCL